MARDSYHHGDLREALVAAALRLVETKGLDGFSMREAAREAGVSAGAPYRHFADKTALLAAVAGEARRIFGAFQADAVAKWDDAPARFRAMGVAGVVFAVERPELFRLLMDRRFRDEEDPALQAEEDQQRALFHGAQRAASDGYGRGHDPAVVQLAAQAMTYGLARLFLDGHMVAEGVSPAQAEDVATAVLDVLGTGFFRDPAE